MKSTLYLFISTLVLIVFFNLSVVTAQAQGTTSTPVPVTADIKADNLSDGEVKDLMQKAQASGMTDEQIKQAALARGMPEAEITKLQNRINIIRTAKDVKPADAAKSATEGRQVNSDEKVNNPTFVKPATNTELSVFGAELFNNSNLTFEPNLRIPTPQNYTLGPDDQVVINVYGNSQVDWKLNISPDGNIQIPGIGLVNVSGKTIEQATAVIKSKLIANHYSIGRGTNVAVSLGNIRSIKVIMVGEIVKPGTITLSSLSTVFNALYLSGGPNNNGSFRKIEIIRDNQRIKTLDIYDFLLKGSQKDNIRLMDGDIIRVPVYNVRVTLGGQVKRPAIYEVLPGETMRDVISFAGGFTDMAYTATVKVTQLTDKDKRVSDIQLADFGNYIPLRGDQFFVDRILDSYQNRVSIFGAVLRPGQFELEKGLTLSKLIEKASGLRPDAFTGRGFISRLKSDNTTELISFDIKEILNKTAADVPLKKEDVISIPSIFDLRSDYTVNINGEVRNGGEFPYADNMMVEDLIVQAGGFTEGASPKRIEISRRINNSDPSKKNSPVSQVFSIDVDETLKLNTSSFKLQPFDIVSVYSLPGYEKQRTVNISGEVLYPGPYAITTKDEKISDLVKRAGGLKASADLEGGRLKRIEKMGVDAQKSKVDINELTQERADRLQHVQQTFKDSSNNVFQQIKNEYVGIDLKTILEKPGSTNDLILEEGDNLFIPKQQQLVKINGEVLFPSSVVYSSSKSFGDYVNNAGGFSSRALRRRAYVIYANGTVKSTRHFLFFKNYPRIKPGSELVVPKRPESKGLSAAEIGSLAGILASAAAVLIGVISIVRR